METALQRLKDEGAVRKVLVIAPKTVAEATWCDELEKWDHLSLRAAVVMGSERERLKALEQDADLFIINRDNVVWLVRLMGERKCWPFDTLVVDEATSFKNPSAQRFKAMKAVRPVLKRCIELTGTPSPNGLSDLWAQMFLLDGGQRLGKSVTAFRQRFMVPAGGSGHIVYNWRPRPGAQDEVTALIADLCVTMRAEDYITLPDIVYNELYIRLSSEAQKKYDQLERDMLLEVTEEQLVVANTAGVLTGKLLQLCNGAVYGEDGTVLTVHDQKLEAFMGLLEQLNGEHALVFYQFQHDRDRLVEALSSAGLSFRVYKGAEDERAWNRGEVSVLLAHPASCAYGLNLQQGGHHVVWFGLTWNLEEFQQANKRLHRRGQEHPVVVHLLLTKGGMDTSVLAALRRKGSVQDELLDALKVRLARVSRLSGGENVLKTPLHRFGWVLVNREDKTNLR